MLNFAKNCLQRNKNLLSNLYSNNLLFKSNLCYLDHYYIYNTRRFNISSTFLKNFSNKTSAKNEFKTLDDKSLKGRDVYELTYNID